MRRNSQESRNALIELEWRDRARSELLPFCQYTKRNYVIAHHHGLIAEKLEAVERGEIKRLMVMIAPRWGKSELVSRRFPAWYLGKHPDRNFISASYGAELALDFGREVRNLCAEPYYRSLFPQSTLAEDSQAKNRWHTKQGGGYLAAGVGTAVTGYGADILNIDDPIKGRAEAESETYRKATWDWYRAVAYTRLHPRAAIVLTMTRWHEMDLAGMLLEEETNGGDQWEKLIIPALKPDGYSAWSEGYDEKALAGIRAVIGPMDWASLYEQRPRPPGGSFFSESSFLVDNLPIAIPKRVDTVYAVIDTAVKTGKEHDGVGVVYFSRSQHLQPPLAILDWDLKQIEGALLETWLPTVYARIEQICQETEARMGSSGAFIEDKASGMVLLQQAVKHQNWQARAIDSKLTAMGKSERAINVSGYVHAGLVKITEPAYRRVATYKGHTKNHLLSQILGFRAGTQDMGEDDLLDCFSYGLAIGLGDKSGF